MRHPALLVILLTAVLVVPATAAQATSPLDEGSALLRQGRFAEAIPFLEEAVLTDPDDIVVLNNLGVALTQVGRFDEAIRSFDLVIDAQPDNALAHAIQAVAFNQMGEPLLAAQAAEQALRLDVSMTGAHYTLGLAWARLGNGPGATTEQDWLYANDQQLAAQLTAELVEIDPSYGGTDTSLSEHESSPKKIDEMPEVTLVDLDDEPGDAITLLGVTAERAYPWDETEWDGVWPDFAGLLKSWFDDFAGQGESQDQGPASGGGGQGRSE